MKNQTSLMTTWAGVVCVMSACFPAYGQITVDEQDLPQAGSAHTFQNLPIDILVDFEASGPGWVWDFSDLNPIDSTLQDVSDVSAAAFPSNLYFDSPLDPEHQADHFYEFLALPDLGDLGLPVEVESIMGYHKTADGMYTQVGLGLMFSGVEYPILFQDVDEVHPVPLAADATLESTSAFALDIPQTLYYAANQSRESVVDGYGTLLLPDGTSHEVLRLRSTVVSEDSLYVASLGEGLPFERETVTYSWLGDGGLPWLEVSTSFGVPTTLRYQGSAPPASDLTEAYRDVAMSPNPVSRGSSVRLGSNAQAVWTLHGLGGQRVCQNRGNLLATESLAPGVYLVRNEATGLTRRLVVQ